MFNIVDFIATRFPLTIFRSSAFYSYDLQWLCPDVYDGDYWDTMFDLWQSILAVEEGKHIVQLPCAEWLMVYLCPR